MLLGELGLSLLDQGLLALVFALNLGMFGLRTERRLVGDTVDETSYKS